MARRRHRHAAAEHEPDDSVGLAGWLYTDLLLGLAVIFLGSIAVIIPAAADDGDSSATTTTTTEVIETTTTLPVRLCTSLYVPAQEERGGIYIELPSSLYGQGLVDAFRQKLQEQLDEENAKPEMAGRPLRIEELKYGLVIAKGGAASNASGPNAVTQARELVDRLNLGLNGLFNDTPRRYGFTTKERAGYVYLEVLPLVESEC